MVHLDRIHCDSTKEKGEVEITKILDQDRAVVSTGKMKLSDNAFQEPIELVAQFREFHSS